MNCVIMSKILWAPAPLFLSGGLPFFVKEKGQPADDRTPSAPGLKT